MTEELNLARGLLEACDDRRLLNFKPYPRQREILAAIEAGPTTHTLAGGRRGGKTRIDAATGLWHCCLRPDLDAMMELGEERYSIVVATKLDQARLVVKFAKAIVRHSRVLRSLLDGETEDELRFLLPGGARTVFKAFPSSSRGNRGWAVSALFLDEAAHMLDGEGNAAAESIYDALAPSTAQFGDRGRIIISSNPYGDTGFFADMYRRSAAGELEDAVAHKATTKELNPKIPDKFLRAQQARNPDTYRQEYEADFLSGGAGFIDFSQIDLTRPAPIAQPDDASSWVMGLDPGFDKDPCGYALLGRTKSGHLVCGPTGAIKATGVFTPVIDEIAELAKRYGATKVISDQFTKAPVKERLRYHGLRPEINTMDADSKTVAYSTMRDVLYDGRLVLPVNPALISELKQLKARYTPGRAAVENPRTNGAHGDVAQALALAVFALAGKPDSKAYIEGWGRIWRGERLLPPAEEAARKAAKQTRAQQASAQAVTRTADGELRCDYGVCTIVPTGCDCWRCDTPGCGKRTVPWR